MAVYIDSEEVQGEIIYFIECKRCGVYRTPDEAYKSGIDVEGVQMYAENECRYCSTRNEDRRRAYKIDPSRDKAYIKEYNKNNPHVQDAINMRYRTRKNALPDDFTNQELVELYEYFGNKCPITGSSNYAKEHFQANNWGQGEGTSVRNIWLCERRLNERKGTQNPFVFFRREDVIQDIMTDYGRTRQQVVEGFEFVVNYLADKNGMSPKEFEEYTYYCFRNQKTFEEIEYHIENGLTVNSRKEFEDYKAGVTNRQ